jgi:Xaa-Pro aminopeptidase
VADQQAKRRHALAAVLVERELDAALVTHLPNVRYLTGFTGSSAALLLSADGGPVLATDGRYRMQAGEEAGDVELLCTRELAAGLLERAVRDGRRRLGVELHVLTVDTYRRLSAAAPVELLALGPAVERLREVKDDGEIELLRAACAIGDRAFADLLPRLQVGLTEREVAAALEERMRAHGAEAFAFETIVASGPNGAKPHHRAGERTLQKGDLVTVDFGARFEGYHSDMTRTVAIGAVADWQREIRDLVAEAQLRGRRALRPGADAREVDELARAVIRAAGPDEHYPHGLGHGVGLQVHEAPTIGYSTAARLQTQVPVTIEPGVYLPGRGGVRIEDVCVVRPGAPELLTNSDRELLVL